MDTITYRLPRKTTRGDRSCLKAIGKRVVARRRSRTEDRGRNSNPSRGGLFLGSLREKALLKSHPEVHFAVRFDFVTEVRSRCSLLAGHSLFGHNQASSDLVLPRWAR